MTTLCGGVDVGLGVVTAAVVGKAAAVGADSTGAVDTVADETCTDEIDDWLGAGPLSRTGVETGDVEAAAELAAVFGCAALVAVAPVAPPLRVDRRVPFVDVLSIDLGSPDKPVEAGGSPPVEDGDPVAVAEPDPVVLDPPAPGAVPGGSEAVGEPLGDDVPVDDPVSGDSVCVVVPDPESPEPVVSA